ncbi:hypothetical protein FRB90_007097, partial [Tulasnella sp. 427]
MLANAFGGGIGASRSSKNVSIDTPQKGSTRTPAPTPDAEVSTETILTISSEYAALGHLNHCPSGMYLSPSTESLLVWLGVLFVHQGYYASSVLRFRLTFPQDYPKQPPAVAFTTDVFHPLVSQTDGSFSLAPRFSPWMPKDHHVFDVLYWIKAAFKKPALDKLTERDCLNKEALRLYRESPPSFAALALQTSGLSQSPSALFDSDHPQMGGRSQGGIVFRQMAASELSKLRKETSCGQALKALFKQPVLETTPASSSVDEGPANAPEIGVIRKDFVSLLALIDNNITKFGMSLKPPLTGAGVVKSIQGVSADLGTLASCSLSVPLSAGKAIRKEFIWTAQEVIESIQGLVSGLLPSTDGKEFITPDDYLRRVGSVHSVLDKVRGSLSADNASAVEKRWTQDSSSLDDALRECKEMMDDAEDDKDGDEDEFDDEEDEWGDLMEGGGKMSAEELERTKKIYPLLRMIVLLHRKTIKILRNSTNIDLDAALNRSSGLVASFDDLIASLAPTQEPEVINSGIRSVLVWVKQVQTDVDMEKMGKSLHTSLKLEDPTKSASD